MVEGPGCTLKGEKMRGRMVGKTVHNVSGTAVRRAEKGRPGHTTSYHQLIGRRLEEVLTLGKELFMFFGDICLRIHFLMAGSFRVNNLQLDKDYSKTTETPALEMSMDGDVISFYKSAADIRSAKECREKFECLKDLDICSSIFNPKRAVTMVMEQTDRMVCDVLLDQLILPGVGNIIKNEALYDSGIRPNTKVGQLTEEHISLLVKMTRDFTMIFYKCRRDGKPLRPYEKVYHVGKCRQCGGKITTTRMGEDSGRVTYFCDHCQNNDLTRFQKQKSSNKTSLLSWVNTGGVKQEVKNWTCSVCTLINPGNQTNCTACLMPKGGQIIQKTQQRNIPQSNPALPSLQPVKQETLVVKKSKYTFRKRSLSNQNQQPESLEVTTNIDMNSIQPAKRQKVADQSQVLKTSSQRQNQKDSQTPRTTSLQKQGGEITQYQNQRDSQTLRTTSSQRKGGDFTPAPSKIPLCPGHKRRCYMKQCWKENQNRGRWFFTCSLPRGKQCNFFEWCDTKFPICEGHGKPCAFRTVMKEGPNNGRKFFACPLGKQKQCGFFEWAVGYDE